ncbi:MAG: transporter [Paramuribaculum sp.]|nr:transporter [Paramuribaculum sp.]MDE6487653.1 transporter [Paramuribaculum sp.]
MPGAKLRQQLKPWMLPIAMACGIVFHTQIRHIVFLTPYLIFIMLLITFCRMDPARIRLDGMSVRLLVIQLFGAAGAYMLLAGVDPVIAQGAFICIFCPTATAAPVVTGMLGGNVERLVAYSLVSNVAVAVIAPVAFMVMGSSEVGLMEAAGTIAAKVAPLILLPLVAALMIRRIAPALHHAIDGHQSVSFYIWAVSLLIVVGNSVSFIMAEPADAIPTCAWLALVAAVACAFQFIAGRVIGHFAGDPVSGAQGLGQKNTVLAIWMALTYLNPLSSIAPAAYVAFQNTVNSVQLYFRQRRNARSDTSHG